MSQKNSTDNINSPGHYKGPYPMEVIDIIKMTLENSRGLTAFEAYCLGNELKYRLRAGLKDPDKIKEDIKKAIAFKEFREKSEPNIFLFPKQHKGLK